VDAPGPGSFDSLLQARINTANTAKIERKKINFLIVNCFGLFRMEDKKKLFENSKLFNFQT
jgi:hypothetical protein